MFKKLTLGFVALLFCACNDEKIDEAILSKGTQTTEKHKQDANNLDLNSYKEIAEFFKNNQNIVFSNKPVLIIFSANNCTYCDKLKHEIQNDKEVQNILKNTYNSYYINTSYHKIHNYDDKKTSTEELAKEFNIDATPTLVFFTPNHKTLLIYPGFMSAKRLALTMEILKEKENHELNKDELFKKLFLAYKEKNV
ncbi:SoxW family protein [Campylobacter helveticus]|uniref:SoxW family protein n=1 Tax=Campylobacter helveticus TaxID=28898 RepID=UPI0011123886|nr:thioredoxin family protein [Campylobacter helveticus]MCR2060599.1 thioredoxin family protein [Campylobacter helveticus]TNB62189.1 thioredoxin [Campylobacter helveticus]